MNDQTMVMRNMHPLKRSREDIFEWGGTLLRQNGNIITH